ncbi:MAG: putative flippase GtrA [Arenicella sp.]|jgi:putative flippase GtrA
MNLQLLTKMFRYGGSSIAALAADVGIMWALFSVFTVPYLCAAAIGFTVGCVVKYVVSKHLVFQDNRQGGKSLSRILYIVIAIACLLLNHAIIYIGVDLLGAHLLTAKVLSAGVIFILNFFLLGLLVFKDPLTSK